MLWTTCEGERNIAPISGILWRLVESQEQVATLGYVDTLEEQALLEEMLEQAKPDYPTSVDDNLHYLLKTPFRYPPLLWGSRFGRVHEPSIFYGGCSTTITLAESAYYRFLFWYSIDAAPVKSTIRSAHTLFSVGYKSQHGVRLQLPPFAEHTKKLAHPKDYSHAQQLGTQMREAGVEVFEYVSARANAETEREEIFKKNNKSNFQKNICVGLYSPKALAQKKPKEMSQWLCELSADEVVFKPLGQPKVMRFKLSQFLFNNKLPMPA